MATDSWAPENRADPASVAAALRGWIPAAQDSPLYTAFATAILDDAPMLTLVGRIDNVPPLNLLFGAVQLMLTADDPLARWYPRLTADAAPPSDAAYAAFRAFALERKEEIVAIGAERRTQTNEVRRSAAILPFVAAAIDGWDGPVHAVDVGAAGGLNTCLDRYAYDYGRGPIGSGPLTLTCENRGGFALPAAVPQFATRTAIDLAPVDVDDPAEVAWLEALIWPEQTDRLERFRAALAVRRSTPVRVVAGDAAEQISRLDDTLPPGGVAIWHTIALYQAPERTQAAIDDAVAELATRRAVARIAFEPWEGRRHPDIRVGLSPAAAEPVASAHAHGAWIDRPV